MSKLHSIIDFISHHKNWFVVIVSAVMILFFDSNSIWARHYTWQSIANLKAEIAELEASYEENSRKVEELRNDPRSVVRVAREKYYMTRPGEDLYIIQSDMTVEEGLVVEAVDSTDTDVQL